MPKKHKIAFKLSDTLWGTPWIEVEFGQRPEGWKLFTKREDCIQNTR